MTVIVVKPLRCSLTPPSKAHSPVWTTILNVYGALIREAGIDFRWRMPRGRRCWEIA